MNQEQVTKVGSGEGFIAALDQSGGSTPKALELYGIDGSQYSNDTEMFDLMHEFRVWSPGRRRVEVITAGRRVPMLLDSRPGAVKGDGEGGMGRWAGVSLHDHEVARQMADVDEIGGGIIGACRMAR